MGNWGNNNPILESQLVKDSAYYLVQTYLARLDSGGLIDQKLSPLFCINLAGNIILARIGIGHPTPIDCMN